MEMTTVSSSPASPTEGDNLCEVNGTNMAMHIVTLLIGLCGLVGNGAVLGLLRLELCNFYILELAFADFLFLLFTIPSTLVFLLEDVFCSPIMPLLYLSFLLQLSVLSYFWALFRLMRRNSAWYMLKLCKVCCHCNIPNRVFRLLAIVQFWAYFALFTVIPTVSSLCPSHEEGHCQAALISMYIVIMLLFAAPVLIILTINFLRVLRGSENQQPKRRTIVISLIVFFIFLLSLCNFLQDVGYIVVSSQVFFLLNCINSSIKPFIYFLAGGFQRPYSLESLRLSLWRVFEEEKEEAAQNNDFLMDTGV